MTRKKVSIKRIASLVLVIVVTVVCACQVYLARSERFGSVVVGDVSGRFLSRHDVEAYIRSYVKSVVFESGNRSVTRDSISIGKTTDVNQTMSSVNLGGMERYIPFWGLYVMLRPTHITLRYAQDKEQLTRQAQKIAESLTTKPIDAHFVLKDGLLVIEPEKPGEAVVSTQIIESLEANPDLATKSIRLEPTAIQPTVSTEQLAPVAHTFKSIQDTDLVVRIDGQEYKLTKDQVVQLVSVDPEAGAQAVQINQQAVAELVAEWSKDVSATPGVTQVEYLDDEEVSRVVGPSGRSLDTDVVSAKLQAWLQKPTADPLEFTTDIIYPRIARTYTYSYSSAQLQAKLDAWTAKTPGSYRIAVRELGGRGREASVNAESPTVMASTYKIFLAYVAYKMAENNELSLDTILLGSRSISQCIEPMIVDSDNDCAIALGHKIGWAAADKVVKDAGFVGVKLNNYDEHGVMVDDKMVSGEQEARFLMQLSAGTLMNSDHTNELLGYMKRQVYRDGIPAGSNGSVVADKVGFLFGYYYHDVGIVYGEKSTYALVIMTEDAGGWTHIREAAQAVYDFMNADD